MFKCDRKKKLISFVDPIEGINFSFRPTHEAMINKFNDVFGLLNTLLANHNIFREVYTEFLREYSAAKQNERFNVTIKYIDSIDSALRFIYNSEQLYNVIPKSGDMEKSEFHITDNEIVEIIRTSLPFRALIFVLASDKSVNEFEKLHIKSHIFRNLEENGTLNKMFNIITSMIYKSVQQSRKANSKKSIWVILTNTFGYTPLGYSIELFNNVIYRALPSVRLDANPVTYFISVAREKMRFLLTKQYKYTLNEAPFEPEVITKRAVLEDQIIYKAIVQNILIDVISKYSKYIDILRCNGYTVFKHIANPIVVKVINVPVNKLALANLQMFNFLAYDIIVNSKVKYNYITRLLLSCARMGPITKLETLEENKEFNKYIIRKLTKYKVHDRMQIKKSMINKIFKHTIDSFLFQEYYDIRSKQKIQLDKYAFVDDYIKFVIDFIDGTFDEQIKYWSDKISHNKIEEGNTTYVSNKIFTATTT